MGQIGSVAMVATEGIAGVIPEMNLTYSLNAGKKHKVSDPRWLLGYTLEEV